MRNITLSEIEYIAQQLSGELGHVHDDAGRNTETKKLSLRACAAMPFIKRNALLAYKTYIERASVLFYILLKKKPLQNSNNATALTSLFHYLSKYNRWLDVDPKELYNFMVWVEQSPEEVKNQTTKAIEQYINAHIVGFNRDV